MTLDQWRARYEELDAEAARLRTERNAARAEAAELQSLIDLQQTRMDAANTLWQDAHPEKEHLYPDLGDLLAWLIEERAVLKTFRQLDRAALADALDRVAVLEQELAEARSKAGKAMGIGEHCRQLRLALADALQSVFLQLPPVPHEGSCGSQSQCDQACSDFAAACTDYNRLFRVKNNPPHHFEQIAAMNATKAEALATAQADAARLREALQNVYQKAEDWHTSVEWEGREYTQAVMDSCDEGLASAQPALAWLAQVKREAAAMAKLGGA